MPCDPKPWTIAISYSANGDDGKQKRVRSSIQVTAPDLPAAYKEAEKAALPNMTLGAILPGHHMRVP